MDNIPLLEVKDLSVIYTSSSKIRRAVGGISFGIAERETFGIVGETGAGKTSTAMSIMGLLPQRTAKINSGEVMYRGRDLLKLTDADMRAIRGAHISMIFQDPMSSLNPVLTVAQQIDESLMLHSWSDKSADERRGKVKQLLEMVGMPASRMRAYPTELSGGMKQRVVIAMALACGPELLIADEPTSALDVTIQAQVLRLMEDLKQQMGMSMIMITHDLGIIAQICDSVGVMYAGEFVECGTVEQLYTGGNHHPYTEGLFGSIPKIDGDEKRLSPIPGLMPDPTNLPSGCKFAPRCRYSESRCIEEAPGQYGAGHTIKCFRFENGGEI